MNATDDYLAAVKRALLEFFRDEPVKIVLFGSRARNDNHRASDIDIGIIPLEPLDEKKITLARERLENLNIPFKVELVNFKHVSEEFRENALKEALVWNDCS